MAIRSPGARPSGESGPTSATTPVSMPPDPVTGFCILPRAATMPRTAPRSAAARLPPPFGPSAAASVSWRNEAASRFSRSTRTRASSGHSSGLGSSRHAACGSAPAGLDDPVQARVRSLSPRSREVLSLHRYFLARFFRILQISKAIVPNQRAPNGGDHVIEQPYVYRRAELAEPDWTRFPGWAQVTREEWESAQWQRAHCVKNIRQLREVLGSGLSEAFCADLDRRPAGAGDDVDAAAAADAQHDGARRRRRTRRASPMRSTPTRCAGT